MQATLNEIECSIAIQNEGFQNLVVGSSVSLDEVLRRAPSNWYRGGQAASEKAAIKAAEGLMDGVLARAKQKLSLVGS